jgi:CBS domain-containing protein
MAENNVGTLVIMEDERPVGILTDRDIVLRGVAPRLDLEATTIESLSTAPLECVHESTPIETALSLMAAGAVRRIVVLDDQERLAGLLAMDDVVELLAEEAASIAKILRPPRHPRTQPPASS